MKHTAPAFPPPLALRPGEFLVPLGSARIPPGGTARLSTQPAADMSTVTYTARPGDGSKDGDTLALYNDISGALPGGATVVVWFDERPPEIRHNDPITPTDDLVNLKGEPPASAPALAAAIAAAMKRS